MKRSAYLWLPAFFSLCSVAVNYHVFDELTNILRASRKQPVIKLYLPSAQPSAPYNEDEVYRLLSQKQVTHYFLPEDISESQRMEMIMQDVLRLKFQCDSMKVIQVQFASESSYERVYRLVKFLNEHYVRRYCLIDESLYIFGTTSECDERKENAEPAFQLLEL